MDTATARPPALQVFEDALGTRHHADAPGGEPLEVLELRDAFNYDAFESALRERVSLLAGFHSTWFSQVRTVQRINQSASKLFVVFDRVHGARLSTVLATTRQPAAALDVNATLCLIRQLVAAIALLHEKLPSVAHGAISTERIIITPKARLVVTDHVLGSALEQLRYTPERYWSELRVPLPNDLHPAFDQRADVMQIGTLALELILGRQVTPDEYPVRIHELTERAWAASANGSKPLPPELRTWLLRMLQLDVEPAFGSAVDAWEDLEQVLGGSDNRASFLALESVMTDYARRVAAGATATADEATGLVAPAVSSANLASAAVASVPPAAPSPRKSSPVIATAPSAARPSDRSLTPAAQKPDSGRSIPPASSRAPLSSTPPEGFFEPPPVVRPEEPEPPYEEPVAEIYVKKPGSSASMRWVAVAAVLVLIAGGGAMLGYRYLAPPAAAEAPGTLVVHTNPAGFQVFIDGQPRGVTPITLELAPGAHELKIATDGEPRVIPFTVTAGSTVSQTIELPKAAPSTGQLTIRTDPPGARVTIDGVASGVSPLTVDGLTPGLHSVALANDLSSVTQDVTIEPGTTASLVVPMSAPQGVPVSGWISVAAPTEIQIYEEGRLLGTSKTDRLMVSAGAHMFEFVNETLGYRSARTLTVQPGKISAVRLDWPKGSMALNAQPWANVWVNGEAMGETPIGNIALPIGTHEVVFRHPEFGEQVIRATVTATAPARVTVDMRKR